MREEILFPLFVVAFIAVWMAITTFLAFLAGHFKLLALFPPDEGDPISGKYLFASGYMNWVHFGSALTVKFGLKGVHLGPMILFRTLIGRHLPCIPWTEIDQVRRSEGYLSSWFFGPKFQVRSTGTRFTLNGRPGLDLQARLDRGQPLAAAPSIGPR